MEVVSKVPPLDHLFSRFTPVYHQKSSMTRVYHQKSSVTRVNLPAIEIGAAEIKMPLLKLSLGSAGSISAGTGLETPETGN